jgi:hypothetical protein
MHRFIDHPSNHGRPCSRVLCACRDACAYRVPCHVPHALPRARARADGCARSPAALLAAAATFAKDKVPAALARLFGLGLIDRFEAGPPATDSEALANKLARPLFASLTQDEQRRIAKAALPALLAAWKDADHDLPVDRRSLEAHRLSAIRRHSSRS